MSSGSTTRVIRGALAAAVFVAVAGLALIAGPGSASGTLPSGCTGTTTITCQYTSAGETAFTVPAGVTTLHVVALGAKGSNGWAGGGSGASVSADLTVTPGHTLYAEVAIGGGAAGGGSSGAGGGAGDLRTCSVGSSCAALGSGNDPRLIVAGGGGGGGAAGGGGAGGAAGFALASAACNPGTNGSAAAPTNNGGGGGGASCSAGGAAGVAASGGVNGSAGAAGLGGAGSTGGHTAGGGGGGYFGGGGGGSDSSSAAGNAGGGGGGSSFVASAATNIAVTSNSAGSSVTISYTAPITAPDAPTGLTATARDASADLSFTAPGDGGSAITSYEYSTDGTNWHTLTTSGPAPVTGTITGLTNGTAYSVQVRAVNSIGPGAASSSAAVTPLPAATAPIGVAASPGNASVDLSFTAPGSNGGTAITGYEYSTDGTSWTSLTTSGTGPITATVAGLTNGTAYSIRVRAVTAIGGGAASAPVSVTPATVPDPPSGLTATAANSSATLSFAASNDNGAAVTRYEYSTDGINWHALTTSGTGPITATVTGLTNGTAYPIQVRAVNSAGAGAATRAVSVTPISVPIAPGGLVATPGDGSVALSFSAPTDDGGSPITGYEYSIDAQTWNPLIGSGSDPITATIDGLTDGTAYSIAVRAVTTIGAGAAATVSATPILPPPPAPAIPVAVAGVSSVTVSWTAPTSATAVTGYTVIANPGPASCSTGSATATSCVVGAVAGQSYTYTVVAHSAPGDSEPSAPSVAVKALAPPVAASAPLSAPTTLTTTNGTITQATPGQHLTAVGTGFASYSSVTVTAYSTPIVLGTVTTNADGGFSAPVVLPTALEAGAHNLVATGADPTGAHRTIRLPFTVALAATTPLTASTVSTPPATTTPVTTTTSELASTGTPAAELIPIGLMLLIAGGTLAVATRRRSHRF